MMKKIRTILEEFRGKRHENTMNLHRLRLCLVEIAMKVP